jgi:putative NADH-flavin reductase
MLDLNNGAELQEDNPASDGTGAFMNISILGASGATGLLLTERCLAAGYAVTVLARTPQTFPLREQIRMVEGNAFDPKAVRETVEGADVVLSALGARSLGKEDVLERAVPLIVAAMHETGVRRIIALGSAGALADSLKKQPAWRRWFVQKIVYNTFLKWPVASQVAQWKTLSTSGLDWTMVMPPMLRNTPARGSYRIDGEALPPHGMSISRGDVADFMMQQIGNPQWVGKGVYIAY